MGVADVRRLWPQILDKVRALRRFTWVMLSQNAQVHSLEGNTVTIGLVNAGARDSFARSGSDGILANALADVLGGTWRVEAIVDPSAAGGSAPPPAPSPPVRAPEPAAPGDTAPASAPRPATPEAPPASAAPSSEAPARPERASADAIAAARAQLREDVARPETYDPDRHARADDPAMDNDGLSHEELLSRTLGAQVISEIPHD